MVNGRDGQKGFTLMEMIVVLAVIAALAAILVPVVFRYIDDAKKAQAAGDVNAIAAAIQQLYKDTGKWPFCKDCSGAGKSSFQSGDATYLTSNDSCTGASNLTVCDTTAPAAGDATWTDALADSLTNHLIKNTPFNSSASKYSTSQPRPWKGAYVDKIPPLDPWARSYVVNILNADPSGEGASQKWVIVLSSGPNGKFDTARDTLGTANPSVGGDDVIARVK